jgi:hypothetical protein
VPITVFNPRQIPATRREHIETGVTAAANRRLHVLTRNGAS